MLTLCLSFSLFLARSFALSFCRTAKKKLPSTLMNEWMDVGMNGRTEMLESLDLPLHFWLMPAQRIK